MPKKKPAGVLAAYTSSDSLAKDVCFAMARAYGTSDIQVTEIDGFGWHVDCLCNFKGCSKQVKGLLGKKADKVNWVSLC